jgi:hypothetical protein
MNTSIQRYKKCYGKHSKCGGQVKPIEEFFSNGKYRRRPTCKACEKLYREAPENKERIAQGKKKWATANAESIKQHRKSYQKTHKEELRAKRKSYRQKPEVKEYNKAYNKKWSKNNKEYFNERARSFYHKTKYDPLYRVKRRVSGSIWEALKGRGLTKNGKTWKYLAYTVADLKDHLESLFETWMNWDNQGVYNSTTWDDNDPSTWVWNIDHIIPHSRFNYTTLDCEEFRKCWALENLRPLSAKRNIEENKHR